MSERIQSVFLGKDNALLDAMLDFYSPSAICIIDVCCNARRMWKGAKWATRVKYYDRDSEVGPDSACSWDALPDKTASVDVLIYDPPHLPVAGSSPKSNQRFAKSFGIHGSAKADNISSLHPPFLREAKRVLKPDGLILAKIKDYIHNHSYQWNLEHFNSCVRSAALTPCDLIIKRDPCGGNLKSGRWKKSHHAKNVHCYWVVVRNGKCEPKP